jgi:hypothetical protein
MEAGAFSHQDPERMTSHPGHHAVRDAGRVGGGWSAFAGAYLMIAGLLNLLWGITALSKKEYFIEDGLVWSSLETWGWIALIAAVVQFTTGALIFARKVGGMILGIVVAMCGMLINLISIGAYPIWSCIGLVCNALVLWAVTVHGDELVT